MPISRRSRRGEAGSTSTPCCGATSGGCGPRSSDGRRFLIHDDYHPGNVLWHRGRISAIVDWTAPGVGQAASDACYLRLDVSLVRGLAAGDAVLAAYEAAMGEPVPDRPFWDLLSATRAVGIADAWYESWVDFGIPGLTLPLVEERLHAVVERALAAI